MSEQLHFEKAPIREALIDLRVVLPADVTLLHLEALCGNSREEYPDKEPLYRVEVKLEEERVEKQQIGFRMTSADKRRAVQFRLDGFTFSVFAPYDSWETFSLEAKQLWGVYSEATKPQTVNRVAVRYINRLDIPASPIELKEWLETGPQVSSALPQQAVSNYYLSLVMPQLDIDAIVIINQTLIQPLKPNTTSIVLDIDLFKMVEFTPDGDEIWSLLDQFRVRKNAIFLGCITAKTVEIIS